MNSLCMKIDSDEERSKIYINSISITHYQLSHHHTITQSYNQLIQSHNSLNLFNPNHQIINRKHAIHYHHHPNHPRSCLQRQRLVTECRDWSLDCKQQLLQHPRL